DDFFRLKETFQFTNLPAEVEARWRLVETAWELQLPSRMLLTYNPSTEMLVVGKGLLRRADITACRDAVNGYQKGKCFYSRTRRFRRHCQNCSASEDCGHLPFEML